MQDRKQLVNSKPSFFPENLKGKGTFIVISCNPMMSDSQQYHLNLYLIKNIKDIKISVGFLAQTLLNTDNHCFSSLYSQVTYKEKIKMKIINVYRDKHALLVYYLSNNALKINVVNWTFQAQSSEKSKIHNN